MKRSFIIGATVILLVAIIFMGIKLSQHSKYQNVFEEIYSITKTHETSVKAHDEDKSTITKETPEEALPNDVDSIVTTYHFEDHEGFDTVVEKDDSEYHAEYRVETQTLTETFTGDEKDKDLMRDAFYKAVVYKWFDERASRFSSDDLGDIEILENK